jgi:hypothetical protein
MDTGHREGQSIDYRSELLSHVSSHRTDYRPTGRCILQKNSSLNGAPAVELPNELNRAKRNGTRISNIVGAREQILYRTDSGVERLER